MLDAITTAEPVLRIPSEHPAAENIMKIQITLVEYELRNERDNGIKNKSLTGLFGHDGAGDAGALDPNFCLGRDCARFPGFELAAFRVW